MSNHGSLKQPTGERLVQDGVLRDCPDSAIEHSRYRVAHLQSSRAKGRHTNELETHPWNKVKNFVYYEINISVVEEVLLWLSELRGEKDA